MFITEKMLVPQESKTKGQKVRSKGEKEAREVQAREAKGERKAKKE